MEAPAPSFMKGTDAMKSENNKRTTRCAKALRSYNDQWDHKSNLIDFLADARHWCDRNCENFAELDRLAYQHYLVELGQRQGG
jgi:hypothetical protein